ncbi:Serine/threonine-protein kinase SIK2 [Armadillidium vulgare]|nr:Serine/threonine-protein kinase SIK2 [Armadillidium vulgare]
MLVLEPSRRYTIKQVKRHRWTQTEHPVDPLASETFTRGERNKEPNEQVLRIMQELGIDTQRTRESVINDAYDNYSAIYLLLLERLKQHRSSIQSERQAWLEQHRRRPSSIAESALRRTANRSSKSTYIPVHSQSLFSHLPPSFNFEANPMPSTIGTAFVNDPSVFQSRPHHGRLLPTLPSDGTSQVYLYNIQSLNNKVGISLSQDSDGGSSLSYVSPPFRESEGVILTTTMAGKSYREGDSGGSTSIDEGVELDVCDSDSSSIAGQQRPITGGLQNLKSSSQQSETFTDSPLGSVTSNESTFESFESQLEPDICESLSSVPQASFSTCARPLIVSVCSGHPPRNLTPSNHLKDTSKDSADRRLTRSPIAFREGRRASDGLMTQGLIAFRQRLIETEKAKGVTELHSVQKEHQALTSHYQWVPTTEEASKQQEQHTQYCHEWRHSYAGSDDLSRPVLTKQRISLPDKLCGTVPKSHYTKENVNIKEGEVTVSKPLQQQLFQHRLQQKRQTFQKQPVYQRQNFPVPGTEMSRRQMVRQPSYKMAQQQPVLPPLPVDLSTSHLIGDISCPPIAEDGGDNVELGAVNVLSTASVNWTDSSLMYNLGNQNFCFSDVANNLQLVNVSSTESNLKPNLQLTPVAAISSTCQSNFNTLQNLPSSFAACQISDKSQISVTSQVEEPVLQIQDNQLFKIHPRQSQHSFQILTPYQPETFQQANQPFESQQHQSYSEEPIDSQNILTSLQYDETYFQQFQPSDKIKKSETFLLEKEIPKSDKDKCLLSTHIQGNDHPSSKKSQSTGDINESQFEIRQINFESLNQPHSQQEQNSEQTEQLQQSSQQATSQSSHEYQNQVLQDGRIQQFHVPQNNLLQEQTETTHQQLHRVQSGNTSDSFDTSHWFGLQAWHGSPWLQTSAAGTSLWHSMGMATGSAIVHQPVCESPILELPENMES